MYFKIENKLIDNTSPFNCTISKYVTGSGDGFSQNEDHRRLMGNVPAGIYTIQARSCVLMALPQLPEILHRRAARCAVASSGVSAPCAHCVKEPKSSFLECQVEIQNYKGVYVCY